MRSPARTTRRCSPPLSSWTARWANRSGSRPTAARAASAVAASAPAASRTSSPTVARSRASRGCWMPSSAPSRPLCSGRPSRVMLPRVGTSRPASIHANVDLPAPLGPVTSTVCPAGMSRSTPLRAGCCHGVPASWTSRAFRTSTRAPRTRAIGRHAAAGGRGLLVAVEVQGVGGGQLVRVVGDVHDGGAVLAHQAVQEFDDVGPAAGIEHRGALVADHHGGPAGDEGGDGEALELAAGQRGRLTLGETGESDPGEQPVDVDVGPRVRPPQQVVDDADAEDLALRPLEDHPRAAGCPEARRPGPVDGALGRRLTGQDPPERRLPGPVRAAHTEEPPSFQRQVDPGEGRPRRPLVADADPGEPDGQGRDGRATAGGLVELPGRRPRQQGRDAAQRRAQGEGRADHPDEHRHGHHRGQQDPPPRHGERDDGASDVESGAGHARGGGEPLGPGPGVGELGQRQRAGVGQHPEQAHREHGVRHAEAHQPDARGPADGPAPAQADPDQRAENARADGGERQVSARRRGRRRSPRSAPRPRRPALDGGDRRRRGGRRSAGHRPRPQAPAA